VPARDSLRRGSTVLQQLPKEELARALCCEYNHVPYATAGIVESFQFLIRTGRVQAAKKTKVFGSPGVAISDGNTRLTRSSTDVN